MATKHDVYEALQAHFATNDNAPSQEQIAKAVGSQWPAVKQHLLRLRNEGVVRWENGDYGTLRLTAKAPKADKNSPAEAKPTAKRQRQPRAAKTSREVTPAQPVAEGSLVGARAVVYDDGELAALEAEVVRAEEHAKFLRGLLDSIREQAPLDAEGALVVGLLARLRQAPKAEG